MYCHRLKRALDATLAALLLALLAPLCLVVALAVRICMGAPVVFRQLRVGLAGRQFSLYKFRTMRDVFGSDGRPIPDAARITSLGRILRRSSLDELPQLWNVLRGDMSLVGPRPLLPEYLPRYSPQQRRRHDVRPGITGWAQINGRNDLSWQRKFELDVWYADHVSLALDFRILVATVASVLTRRGISARGEATMTPFMGNPENTTTTL